MRIALDSSVLIAAHISRAGVCAELLEDILLHQELLPALGTAIAGECSLLISVDRDLLNMRDIRDIPIIRPGDYWRRAADIE